MKKNFMFLVFAVAGSVLGSVEALGFPSLETINNNKKTVASGVLALSAAGFGVYGLRDEKVRSIAWTLISGSSTEKELANKEIDACLDGSLGRKVKATKLSFILLISACGWEAAHQVYSRWNDKPVKDDSEAAKGEASKKEEAKAESDNQEDSPLDGQVFL
jgi:hypothetical protein